jgi:hypothetical protein
MNTDKENASIIDAIADHVIDDHVEIMLENAALRAAVEMLKNSLAELLDEYHPAEHWTDAHIEYENEQGNMMAPVVRRAKDALQAAKNIGETK